MSVMIYEVRVYENGNTAWYYGGKLHRENGPALEFGDASRREWFRNGKRHRDGGPAVEYANGHKEWYRNGELHREDGPAVEHTNGTKFWYINGELHREDGPAAEYANGNKEWWINSCYLTEEQFNSRNKPACDGKVVEIDGVKYKLVEVK